MGALLAGLASGAGMAGSGGVMGGIGNMLGNMITGNGGSGGGGGTGPALLQPSQGQGAASQDPSSITVNPYKSSYDPKGDYGIAPWHQYLIDNSKGPNSGSST